MSAPKKPILTIKVELLETWDIKTALEEAPAIVEAIESARPDKPLKVLNVQVTR